VKLQEKKASTKVLRTKFEILKNEEWNEKPNIWEIAIERLNWKAKKTSINRKGMK